MEYLIWLLATVRTLKSLPSKPFRVWPHGDRRLYRLGIKVDYGGMDERYAMNKTIASRLNDPCSVIAALR